MTQPREEQLHAPAGVRLMPSSYTILHAVVGTVHNPSLILRGATICETCVRKMRVRSMTLRARVERPMHKYFGWQTDWFFPPKIQ